MCEASVAYLKAVDGNLVFTRQPRSWMSFPRWDLVFDCMEFVVGLAVPGGLPFLSEVRGIFWLGGWDLTHFYRGQLKCGFSSCFIGFGVTCDAYMTRQPTENNLFASGVQRVVFFQDL